MKIAKFITDAEREHLKAIHKQLFTLAAEAIEDFYLSPEGQKLIVNGWMYGVRSDVKDTPYDGKELSEVLKNIISVDWEKCYKERDTIRTMFEEYVTVPAE